MELPLAHHGYLLVGDPEETRKMVLVLAEQLLGVNPQGHPDWYEFLGEQIAIAEARKIREDAARGPVSGAYRLFFLGAYSITTEAQQALLKTFEEPVQGVHFFLVLPSTRGFLSTLRSRLVVEVGVRKVSPFKQLAEDFLKAYPKKRLDLVADLLAKASEADEKKAAREDIGLFLDSIEEQILLLREKVSPTERIKIMEEVLFVRDYLRDPASAPRLLVEHLALVLPLTR